MQFIIKTLLPIILFIGFISYMFKVYYHFQYLKLIKEYSQNMNFIEFIGGFYVNLMDRIEIILPVIINRKDSKKLIREN